MFKNTNLRNVKRKTQLWLSIPFGKTAWFVELPVSDETGSDVIKSVQYTI